MNKNVNTETNLTSLEQTLTRAGNGNKEWVQWEDTLGGLGGNCFENICFREHEGGKGFCPRFYKKKFRFYFRE